MNSIQILNMPTQLARQDRRRSLRVQAAVQVEMRVKGSVTPIRGETTDISVGGFYVEMSVTLPVGTPVEVALWLGEKKVTGSGVVVTSHPQFGNGVELSNLSEQDRINLAVFVDSVMNPAPEPAIQ